jgi:hypothetical protein
VNGSLITKLQNTVKVIVSSTAWSGQLYQKSEYLLVHGWLALAYTYTHHITLIEMKREYKVWHRNRTG